MTPASRRRLHHHLLGHFPKFHLRALPPLPIIDKSWLLVLAYLACLILLFFGPVFRVRSYRCTTNTGEACPDFILPELAKNQGSLVYLFNPQPLRTRFHQSLPQAETILITPTFPNRLTATITWQPGIANLQIPASTSALLVGQDGHIITLLPDPDPTLPIIIASSAADLIIADQLTETSLLTALTVIKSLSGYAYAPTKVLVNSSLDIRALLGNRLTAVFSAEKPILPQIETLHLLLTDPTINQSLPVLDVRFERPVLKPAL